MLEFFKGVLNSDKFSGLLLIACTVFSLVAANSGSGAAYSGFWMQQAGPLTVEHWINDGLMAVFFLLIGLELERELYVGALSNFRNALLPVIAAVGGMLVPAGIFLLLNAGTATAAGFGIPMATDIAFALCVLALLGARVPAALRAFVVAFAVMDDLGAIIIIALFYTTGLSIGYLLAALAVWGLLIVLNRMKVMALWPYLAGGALMWFCMLNSGVHATIAGVLLAFAIPFTDKDGQQSPSRRLEQVLHKPVVLVVLPIFALANTAVILNNGWADELMSANSLGIAIGLLAGKPIGVAVACVFAVRFAGCRLPAGVAWRHIVGAGILGGIGFTMSIFIANLAFANNQALIDGSKVAILLSSTLAGIAGFLWLRASSRVVD